MQLCGEVTSPRLQPRGKFHVSMEDGLKALVERRGKAGSFFGFAYTLPETWEVHRGQWGTDGQRHPPEASSSDLDPSFIFNEGGHCA